MKSFHRRVVYRLAPLFAFVAFSAVAALAQVTTADITGRVLDQLGAAVPNANVTIRSLGTGQARTATTNEEGDYTITQLPPGNYEMSVEAQSFSKAVVKEMELNIGTKQTLNFDLKPGELTETIEVSADSLLVETTRSDISGTVTPTEIQNLPLLGRTLTGLAIIIPEARPSGNFDPTKTRIGNFAMNGGDGRQLDVNVDGGSNKDNVVGSLVQNFSYESIREFQVNQHRWTAEQGRSVGGVVNVVTKSGSNELHGSAFGQFRDEAFRRLDFFEDRQRSLLTTGTFEKPPFSRQEFGGSLGGPIVRDKLFFFGAFERFRERSNNFTPAARAAQLAAIPGAEPAAEIPLPYNDTLFTIKADHNISDRQTMFYRYAQQNQNSINDQIAVPANADLSNGNTNTTRSYNLVVNHTATFSPTKLNVFTFHYLDFKNQILGVGDRQYLQFPTVVTGTNVNVPQETIKKKYQLRNDFSLLAGAHTVKFGGDYINTDLGGFFNFGASGYQVIFFDDPLTIVNNTNGRYPQGFATPGAARNVNFFAGETSSEQLAQRIHQLAFYVQDDYRVSPRLTLNLGLRWDANIGILPDQTNNRTIRLLQQLNHPRAQAITGDPEKLSRTTPSYTEFQPRVGFAFDPRGDGRTVIRGGYGIFYDQIFQNLTLFSLQQTRDLIYQQVLGLTNSAVGVGQLAPFRFGVDPLPAVPASFSASELALGAFGRINDPDAQDPYVQKFSIGVQTELGRNFVLSSDFTHTLGLHEPRVQVINPLIRETCDASFPGSTPTSTLCARGANTRLFDRAFVDAGLGANRLAQINMIGTTNRSLYDSWTTTIRRRTRGALLSASYVLSSSRAWGGQPLASYAGNAIQVTPENQFKPEEFGPTRIDERHRIVASGVVELPGGFQLAPILQFATSRPYSLNTGVDVDGDGLATIDRVCEGVNERAVFDARGNSAAIAALNPPGCRQSRVNNRRGGFITDPATGAIIEERSGRFFNVDLRAAKVFRFG
ncbi:MAG TPA: TonB-dependent receptor, partial [Pyrinomonadaceae bacterium]|nr:TonB-dependent receptor [Pyrinomonadaceae bacterium]